MNIIPLAALIVLFIGLSLIDPTSGRRLKRKSAAAGSEGRAAVDGNAAAGRSPGARCAPEGQETGTTTRGRNRT